MKGSGDLGTSGPRDHGTSGVLRLESRVQSPESRVQSHRHNGKRFSPKVKRERFTIFGKSVL